MILVAHTQNRHHLQGQGSFEVPSHKTRRIELCHLRSGRCPRTQPLGQILAQPIFE